MTCLVRGLKYARLVKATSAILLCCVLGCGQGRWFARADGPPPERRLPVATAASLEFYSGFWSNLHHVLYAEAWARRPGSAKRTLAGAFPSPLVATLTADEHRDWDAAVRYYDQHYADQDLLFDDELSKLTNELAPQPDAMPLVGPVATLEVAAVLKRAAVVYRAHWWPAHDRANRAWIAETEPRVAMLAHAVPPMLARRYGTPWFSERVQVDVVFVASAEGAYTSLDPTHITISASDPSNQAWSAVEAVYHEASHGLVKPVCDAFDQAERAAHRTPSPPLCHAALFYLTGEVVRQALAARGITYVPYLESSGLLDRAWPRWRAPLEQAWRPYVDGEVSLEAAVQRVVSALPAQQAAT